MCLKNILDLIFKDVFYKSYYLRIFNSQILSNINPKFEMIEPNLIKNDEKPEKQLDEKQLIAENQKNFDQINKKGQKVQTVLKPLSMVNNIFKGPKFLISQNSKNNPLLLHPNQQDKSLVNQTQAQIQDQRIPEKKQQNRNPQRKLSIDPIREEANNSLLSLPPDIKQEAIKWIVQQPIQINQMIKQIQHEFKIQITDSVQKGNPLSKYILYTIQGSDMHGRYCIKRKFSQFLALKKIIAQRWPGSFVPGLKGRIQIKNQIQKQLSIRKVLSNFLICLSHQKHIYYKEQVQLFLRSPDVDICQMFDNMPQLKFIDLISRFQNYFGEQIQQLQGPKITEILSNFHKKLRKMINKMEQMSLQVYELAESYDLYHKNLMKLSQCIRLYEHFSLAQFTNNNRQMTIVVKDDERRMDRLKQISQQNPYYQLLSLIQIQLMDSKSFLQTIIAIDLITLRKQQIQQQILTSQVSRQELQSNAPTIKIITTRKHKQQMCKILDEKILKLKKQKDQAQAIFNIIQNVTVNHIIPIFKVPFDFILKIIKKKQYKLVLLKWIEIVGKQIPQLQDIWKFINNQTNQIINRIPQSLDS